MKTDVQLQPILEEYRDRLRTLFGADLDSVALYGSRARGESTLDSDIDVLCVLRRPFDYGEVVLRVGEPAAQISLENDVVISTAFVTRKDLDSRQTPFLMNVRREARFL